MAGTAIRFFFMIMGWASLGLGLVGIFMPLLPTTPFLLLAAFCFQRSSKRLHDWLINQPTFGPIIQEWNTHHIIRPRVKWVSISLLWLLLAYPLVFKESLSAWFKVIMILVGIGVTFFIASRRSSFSDGMPQELEPKSHQEKG